MTSALKTTDLWRHTTTGLLQTIGKLPLWIGQSHHIQPGHTVSRDFFGVNVATSDDPRCDDYIVNALQDLQIRNVRLSYSYDSVGASSERFLVRLLDEGFDVLLALLPSHKDAATLAAETIAQDRWRTFVEQVMQTHGHRISTIEIGNTPNRGRWSGYSSRSYLVAWQIAAQVLDACDKPLAGPNVSDFEPIYNMGYLSAMRALHSAPVIHTNNLFVERVVEPEAYDHRVANRKAAGWLNLNLVKKSNILADISRDNGISKTYCTYTCWSRKRLTRWSAEPEQKNAHYLMRYLVLTSAGGSLDRVYWGPLVCQRDGLIGCSDTSYPDIDNVSYYRKVRGDVTQFSPTAAYNALRFCIQLLSNSTCLRAHNDNNGVHHFVFSNPIQGEFHVVWCADRCIHHLADLYSTEVLARARFYTPEGMEPGDTPVSVTEQPLILRWEYSVDAPDAEVLQQISQKAFSDVVHWPREDHATQTFHGPQWRGAFTVARETAQDAPAADSIPALLPNLPELKVLRDKRNRLWNVQAPWWSKGEQTVKLNRARGIKRFTYRFLPSKAKRHWNNATEMLRLGVNTPQPLGFFEQTGSSAADSYYVCQYIENAFSCRDVFTAFKEGHNHYLGIDKPTWLERIGEFVAHMHWRGIVHRDLSSGNLMMTEHAGGITFYLIDIGRAIIDRPLSSKARMRFKDLNRICFKLAWPDRELLIQAYDRHTKQPLPKWWRLSLASYDWKQNSKKTLKGNRKPKQRSIQSDSHHSLLKLVADASLLAIAVSATLPEL